MNRLSSHLALAGALLLAGVLLWFALPSLQEPSSGEPPAPAHLEAEMSPSTTSRPPESLVIGAARDSVSASTPTPIPSPVPEWAVTSKEIGLFSPWGVGGEQRIPEGSLVRVWGTVGSLWRVYYAGDGGTLRPTEGLVIPADIAPAKAPRWVAVRRSLLLRDERGAEPSAARWIPAGSPLEVLEDRGKRLHLFFRGDAGGRERQDGWADVVDLVAAGRILGAESRGVRWLDKSRFAALDGGRGVLLKVPFRTQIDGSRSAAANCGPASIAMVLEYFQMAVTIDELRGVTLDLQGTPYPDVGVAIEYMAQATGLLGLRGYDLMDGEKLRRWTLDGLRDHLNRGHPLVVQLRFRLMPGRGGSDYWEDHYVVVCGYQGDDFIYNDPVDVDGPGFGRLISSDVLSSAWEAAYCPLAAFAISGPE